MNPLQETKVLSVIKPVAIVNNASWTTTEIDTKDWDYAQVIFQYGTSDVAMAALKMQESDTSGSGMADITGLVAGTSSNIDGSTSALPGATDDDSVVVFDIDLRGRKRYLDLVATAGNGSTGSYGAAVCILSRGKIGPTSMAERGGLQVLRA